MRSLIITRPLIARDFAVAASLPTGKCIERHIRLRHSSRAEKDPERTLFMDRRIIVCVALALLMSGCVNVMVSHLGEAPKVDTRNLMVVDHRTPEQKARRRDSAFSAIAYLGENDVSPPTLIFLESALQKRMGPDQPLSLEISEMRVIDFFPARLRAAGGANGFVGNAIFKGLVDSKTDLAFVEHLAAPENLNSIIFIFAGTLNGKPVKTATFQTYVLPVTTVSVRNSPNFVKSVIGSIDAAAADMVSQAEVAR
jgi:hypothetical protein